MGKVGGFGEELICQLRPDGVIKVSQTDLSVWQRVRMRIRGGPCEEAGQRMEKNEKSLWEERKNQKKTFLTARV